MEIKARVKYLRIGPRKVRPILNLIRRKYVRDAFDILTNINKKGARLTERLLRSSVANAKVKKIDEENLFISDIRADGGPMLKRFMARAMGRADRILKRTTHINVVLVEKERAVQKGMLKTEEAYTKEVKKTRGRKPKKEETKVGSKR